MPESKKSFKHFFEFPSEIRMMVINKTGTEDRCRLRGCSKLSDKEAKSSKNFVHALKLTSPSNTYISIQVDYEKCGSGAFYGYILKYEKLNEEFYLKYFNSRHIELWSEKLDASTDLLQLSMNYFTNLLKSYEKSVKSLAIYGQIPMTNLMNIVFGIGSLNSLKSLRFCDDSLLPHILPKVRRPLRSLESTSKEKEVQIGSLEQIYQVENCLFLNHAKLNYEQFQRLSASEIRIHIGYMSPEDIFNFIKSWNNGQVRKTFKECRMQLEDSDFYKTRLSQLLGTSDEFWRTRVGTRPQDTQTIWISFRQNVITLEVVREAS